MKAFQSIIVWVERINRVEVEVEVEPNPHSFAPG